MFSKASIARLLEAADLRPEGLSPAAVLVVRRMEDPLPGGLARSPGDLRPRLEWERQARRRLGELARRAARPLRSAAGHGDAQSLSAAEAVLFADESELLACLALDVSRGLALGRWWWQAVLRTEAGRGLLASAGPAEALARQMERQAALVPAALALLDRLGEAPRALLALSPAQGRRVLEAVLAACGLPSLSGGESAGQRTALPASRPPWKALPAALGLDRETLLGWALDLYRRPQAARSPAYRRQVLAWRFSPAAAPGSPLLPGPVEGAASQEARGPGSLAVGAAPPAGPPAASSPGEAGAFLARGAPAPGGVEGAAPPISPSPAPEEGAPQPGRAGGISQPASEATDAGEARPTRVQDRSAPGGQSQPLASPEAALQTVLPAVPQAAPQTVSQAAWAVDGLPTHIGGCLYLINLMAYLDLPGAFEDGWRLASRVGAWGLLEALGRELIGPGYEGDPLWPALASLDGRPPSLLPGFRLPRSRPRRWPPFQLPASWGTAGQPGEAVLPRRRTQSGVPYPPVLGRWLRLALPFIDRRLRLALGLEHGAGLAEGLLRLPARLYITSSHVDLVASIEDISLPARLAGLDRNPGWLPEFGRVIYFHFEQE